MGSVSMGIAGSIVNPDFFQEYLGMRNESVDLTEIILSLIHILHNQVTLYVTSFLAKV